MNAITAVLLLLGTLAAAFGTLVFLENATTQPDRHTLLYARNIAVAGRRLGGPSLAMWIATWHGAGPLAVLLLVIAAAAFTGSYVTRGASELARRLA